VRNAQHSCVTPSVCDTRMLVCMILRRPASRGGRDA